LTVQPRAEPPEPDRTWLKVTKDAHEAFWASDVASLVAAKDESALRRLFDQRNLHQRLYRMVNKYPLIDGPQGRPVLNPAARLMTAIGTEIRQLEREFGLTPDAGARMVTATASATRSVEDLVRSDTDLQVIDVAADTDGAETETHEEGD
jgi:P27 family predicted phage terminase small subunit